MEPRWQPPDRTSFFDEQARHRRATRWIGLLCVLTVAATAILLSGVLSPIVAGSAVIALRLVGLVVSIPDDVWTVIRPSYQLFGRFIDRLYASQTLRASEIVSGALAAFVLMLPGVLVVMGVWTWLRRTLDHDGMGGMLRQLGARDPDQADPEERQLVNVVAELAIAAGLAPPRVLLTDHPVTNAALIGTSECDAVVLVSRRVLDELDRQATQGLVGQLIGSLSNGDLRIALLSLSVFQTFGLISTLLDVPFSLSARTQVRQLISAVAAGGHSEGATPAELVSVLLAASLDDRRTTEITEAGAARRSGESSAASRFLGNACQLALLPVLVTSLFAKMVIALVGQVLLGSVIAWAWRTRRYLADATAVQLTRDPEALARALRLVGLHGGELSGGAWAAHLFIVDPDCSQETDRSERIQTASGPFASGAIVRLAFHPPLDRRIERLVAQGARPPTSFAGQQAPILWGISLGGIAHITYRVVLALLVLAYLAAVGMLAFLGFAVGMAFVGDVLVP